MIVLGAVLATATGSAALAQPGLQDQRQAACYKDAQRLCGQFVPDVGNVTACMKPRKNQVSAGCRALWDLR